MRKGFSPGTLTCADRWIKTKNKQTKNLGRLGGSVGGASDFSSGHDLTVGGFEPPIRHVLKALSLEPASDSVSPSLSAPPPLMLCLSLSLSLK